MATADARVAKEQLRHLRGRKSRLQEEKQVLQNASTRILEINAEIDIINAQIDIIRVRDPEDGNPPPPAPTGAPRT